jgi:hypothetical protein
MIQCFNSNWIIILSILISFIIIKKIYNLLFKKHHVHNRKYIQSKYEVNEKMLPTIAAYYVGLN